MELAPKVRLGCSQACLHMTSETHTLSLMVVAQYKQIRRWALHVLPGTTQMHTPSRPVPHVQCLLKGTTSHYLTWFIVIAIYILGQCRPSHCDKACYCLSRAPWASPFTLRSFQFWQTACVHELRRYICEFGQCHAHHLVIS